MNMHQEMPSFDYVGMLWRRKWLLLFGALLGVGIGYLWYTKQPPVYQSSAEVQIIAPNAAKNMPIEGFEYQAASNPLADEIRVIRSELVLRDAAQMGDLSKTKTFSGMSNEQIASILSSSGSLNLSPVNGNLGGNVITVAFSCNDPNESRRIVQSVVDAYSKYLQSLHRNVGEETLSFIDEARGDVLQRLQELEREYDKFKQTTLLVNRGGTRTSVHRENADQLLAEKQKLSMERTTMFGQHQAISQALEAKQDPAAILAMLKQALGESLLPKDETLAADEGDANDPIATKLTSKLSPRGQKRSEMMRQDQLFPLQLKEQELLSAFAPSHPAVASLRIKIAGIEQLIAEVEASEKRLELEMQKELDQLQAEVDKAAELRAAGETGPEDPMLTMQRQINIRLVALDQGLKSLDQQLAVISDAYNNEREQARIEEGAEVRAAGFERDISRQRELYERIVARFDELNIITDIDGRRVSELNSPKQGWQIAPSMSRNLSMGCFLGLLGAAGIGYLLEWSDKSYHSPDEIAEHLRMPVIGHIPAVRPDMEKVKAMKSQLDPSLCTYFQPRSTFCEAYRAIRTALYFSSQKRDGVNKVIQVTSAVPSDGKSTITANLAVTTAQAGKNVLLIDCDFRRPRVHQLFKLESKRGVAWLVQNMPDDPRQSGAEMIGEAVQETEIPNLCVMPCGERPANPAELLSSPKFDRMLTLLKEKFDLILIDSPPLLAVTDPSNIAGRVDGVILVIRIRKVIRPMAVRASRMLETLGANVLGVVVNGVGSREAYGYGSKYYRSRTNYYGGDYYRSGYGYSYGNSYGTGDQYEYGNYYEDPADSAAAGGKGKVAAKQPGSEATATGGKSV
ncbi:Tyrosine-protein kinase YwqD [Rosistilla carotiformis]|uniref:Tyrosine-protein kinase YwqD n=1 Tax=Rosistilla carotiformis TaxID=2528017 RepID=A0A518JTK0_9BACT|nr:polysaccharide biosynthesis tyrosine autokinase [Rosistilla carotiformis]QDV68874.1 Tyrosine-protein kinase YwqD [Rosistilla carotiformis]